MKLVGHAAHGRDQKYVQKCCKGGEDLGIDGRKILESIWKKQGEMVSTEFIWLKIGTIGELTWIRQWTFGFSDRLGISSAAEKVLPI